jgi:NADPH-dependent 2,4-dienoyl-CoA reductase/sulfur reductase-like enzyme
VVKKYDVIFIGGGLASIRGAFHLKQIVPESEVAIFSNENTLPYDRPPLSKEFLRGEKSSDDIRLHPSDDYQKQKIDLYTGTPIREINPDKKTVITMTGEIYHFEKLFLATGGTPKRLKQAPENSDRICYLRSIQDAAKIRSLSETSQVVGIIGGGFIGLEVATSLASKQLEVHLFDRDPFIWKRFLSSELAQKVRQFADNLPIHFHLNANITSITDQNGKIAVQNLDRIYEVDFLCIGIGIELNLDLARKAGLEINHGVRVNSCMQTSHPDIYAGGDITEFFDPYLKTWRVVEHWGHAEYSGLVAATNMAGQLYEYDLLNYAWTDIFGIHIDMAGLISSDLHMFVRGNPDEKKFIILYTDQNVLKGYMGFNYPRKEYAILQKWIKKEIDISSVKEKVLSANVDLKELDSMLRKQ